MKRLSCLNARIPLHRIPCTREGSSLEPGEAVMEGCGEAMIDGVGFPICFYPKP